MYFNCLNLFSDYSTDRSSKRFGHNGIPQFQQFVNDLLENKLSREWIVIVGESFHFGLMSLNSYDWMFLNGFLKAFFLAIVGKDARAFGWDEKSLIGRDQNQANQQKFHGFTHILCLSI